MSHFILLRQRIKVIETIKKTTGAMRLISMSLHSRLRNQKAILETYASEIRRIAHQVAQDVPTQEEVVTKQAVPKSPLIVLIGSQKGLCGAFNDNLFQFFQKKYALTGNELIVTVGKYATEYMKNSASSRIDHLINLAYQTLLKWLIILKISALNKGRKATIFSNAAPTFFSQKPREQVLNITTDHHNELVLYLNSLQLKATFLHILHESLLAEQAARFVSMDMAYRNAETILNQTKLDYNKTRQAYVTRELIELSGGMIAQE